MYAPASLTSRSVSFFPAILVGITLPSGDMMLEIVWFIPLSTVMNRTIFNPPPVDPAELPMTINAINIISVEPCHVLIVCAVLMLDPVVVTAETTWNSISIGTMPLFVRNITIEKNRMNEAMTLNWISLKMDFPLVFITL